MIQVKKCSKCGETKELFEFPKRGDSKDGYRGQCISCTREIKKQYAHKNKYRLTKYSEEYRKNNKEKISKRGKQWNKDNYAKLVDYRKIYYKNNREDKKEYGKNYRSEHIEKNKKYKKEYYKQNKDKIKKYRLDNAERIKNQKREYHKKNKESLTESKKKYDKCRTNSDPVYKFKKNVRSLISSSFSRKGIKKNSKTTKILGCTLDFFKEYVEKQLPEGKTLKDMGRFGFHIDHIIPLATAATEEEVIKLCHYTNLRPLWWFDNLTKHSKLDWKLNN